ncbi:MAG TPA: cytochrome c [Acidobacteria bacterium]|nr:cytochrome c [Acidobacteriota bacterium]
MLTCRNRHPWEEVPMTERTAKLIFWIGTLTSLALFLVLTVDTHRQFAALTHADRLDATVVAGKRTFERYNCNDCHTILGFGGYYAPDLTRAYTRLGEDTIRRVLEHPEVAFADSYRKMPQQHLKPEEIKSVIAFLAWVSGIENHDWPPQHSEHRWKRSTDRMLAAAALSPAAALIKQEECLSCHALGSLGERKGPRFEWIARRRSAQWIAEYIKDPEAKAPGVEMPAFSDLSPQQRGMIAEFIVSLAKPDGR